MTKQKKGMQLGQAFGAVLALVLVSVLVVIAIYMFTALGTSVLPTTSTTSAAINESFTPITTNVSLGAGGLISGSCGSITAVYNGSNTLVAAGNYTQSGCLLANKTGTTGSSWNVNYPYTYTAPSAAYNATGGMVTNFSGYPTLIGLVGTIIFLGLVIGVLVASFVFGGKNNA